MEVKKMEKKVVNIVVEKSAEGGYKYDDGSFNTSGRNGVRFNGVYEVERTVAYYEDGSREVLSQRGGKKLGD